MTIPRIVTVGRANYQRYCKVVVAASCGERGTEWPKMAHELLTLYSINNMPESVK